MRYKNLGMLEQQAEDLTLKQRSMDFLCASCDRDELFTLMAKVNDRITYLDNISGAFKGLYGRSN